MGKKVFISYAREDLKTAEKLFQDLKKNGFEPWLDEKSLLAGKDWRQTIERQIRETDYVLILISERSVFKRGFVQVEQVRALEVLETVPPQDIFIVPVRLEECSIPDRLERWSWVDLFLSYETGLDKILRSLSEPRDSDRTPPQLPRKTPEPSKHEPDGPPLVYVSYALADDKMGWVKTLAEHLDYQIGQRLVGGEPYRLYFDHSANSEAADLTSEIAEKILGAAVFIAVVSPKYLSSERCDRERNTFLRKAEKGGDARFHAIERMEIIAENRPDWLNAIRPFRFWERKPGRDFPKILGDPAPNPERDAAYFDRIFDLSESAAKAILCVQPSPGPDRCVEPTSDDLPAIFLAETTEDLLEARADLERYLDQSGFRVLPEQGIPPTDSSAFESAVDAALEDCLAFVQLLGAQAGKSRLIPEGICGLQHQCAVKRNMPIFEWRHPDLSAEDIADEAHRSLVFGCSVQAVRMTEFRRDVVRRAKSSAKFAASPDLARDVLVFLNAHRRDEPHARKVADLMISREIGYALPAWDSDEADMLADMEGFVMDSQGVIVVYGDVESTWARKQVRYCRNINFRREKPLDVIAVYDGPPSQTDDEHPPEKPRLNIDIPGVKLVDCRDCFREDRFGPVFEALGIGGPQ